MPPAWELVPGHSITNPPATYQYDLVNENLNHRRTLNADVIVLSACETGVGRLQGQEGVMNLARAFFTAGAKGNGWQDTQTPRIVPRNVIVGSKTGR